MLRRRTVITLIGALGFSIASSFALDPVYSVNVVGFQKLESDPSAFDLKSTPFLVGTQSVNEVISDQMAEGDQIYIWDVGLGSYITLTKDADGTWHDELDNVATNKLFPKMGFWVENKQSTTQTPVVVGDVITNETLSVSIETGFQLLSYPFSAAVEVNDTSLTNGTAGSDKLYLWDVDLGSYVTLSFDTDYIWKDELDNTASNSLDPSIGFWYEAAGPFTWIETKPYTSP